MGKSQTVVMRGEGVTSVTVLFTPEPRPLKKGIFDTNAAINSEGSGDMSSTQYNQI